VKTTRVAVAVVMGLLFAGVAPALAQDAPAPPPKDWTATAGVGLALTNGNSDTSTFNANYNVVYDPKRRNIVKSDGLYIRGDTEGTRSSDRLSLNVRDEYKLTSRAYVFGQNQYLRDVFKEIDYLLAPTGGLGYKLVDNEATKLSVDGGLGAVWEKNPGLDVRTSGAITMDEKFSQAVSGNTTLTQSIAALWKTKDFDDALYQFGAGLAVAMSTHTQLKLEALSTYKTLPPTPGIDKNDVSLLVAFVFKN
jgi:putative salt-induced outer membrane protein YdiY